MTPQGGQGEWGHPCGHVLLISRGTGLKGIGGINRILFLGTELKMLNRGSIAVKQAPSLLNGPKFHYIIFIMSHSTVVLCI